MRLVFFAVSLLLGDLSFGQSRLELVAPYDGTSNNFIRITGYRACTPSVYAISRVDRNETEIDITVETVRAGGGCPPGFVGTPTEKSSYLSLAQAVGDGVMLPTPLTIRIRDANERVFGTGSFEVRVPDPLIPLENGCYALLVNDTCVERHNSQFHFSIDYYPMVADSAPSSSMVFGSSVHADVRLLRNYARLELKRPRSYRRPRGGSFPEYESLTGARVAIISPTEFVMQIGDEPSFAGVRSPWIFSSDWARLGSASNWLLSLGEDGIFGGFKIRFGRSVFPGTTTPVTPDFEVEGARWEYPAFWDFGSGRLSCSAPGCDLYLRFGTSGPEFIAFRIPKGGLGVGGSYTRDPSGSWRRVLIRVDD